MRFFEIYDPRIDKKAFHVFGQYPLNSNIDKNLRSKLVIKGDISCPLEKLMALLSIIFNKLESDKLIFIFYLNCNNNKIINILKPIKVFHNKVAILEYNVESIKRIIKCYDLYKSYHYWYIGSFDEDLLEPVVNIAKKKEILQMGESQLEMYINYDFFINDDMGDFYITCTKEELFDNIIKIVTKVDNEV